MDIRDDPERDTPHHRFKIRTVTPSAKASSSGYTLAADAIRAASQDDASLVDCWDFDVGGPLFNGGPGCCIDASDIQTVLHDNAGNRIRIEAKIREVLTLQAVPILLGTALSFAALAVWVVYGLANSAVMRSGGNAPDSLAWTSVQGLGALIGSMLLLPFTSLGTQTAFTPHQIETFILWSLLMGLAGSWLATVLWVAAARRLPLSLAAQLIVAETIFGVGLWLPLRGASADIDRGNRRRTANRRRVSCRRSLHVRQPQKDGCDMTSALRIRFDPGPASPQSLPFDAV